MHTKIKFALLFAVMHSMYSFAATPTVSSAVLTGSTIKVSGTNFGTKSTAAPFFFQPFTSVADGATPADAGFDSWINRGGEAVTLADGVGGGSLRFDPGSGGANNAHPHTGVYLPSGNQQVLLSFFARVYGDATGIGPFLKIARAGKRSGGDPSEDYSSTAAKFYPRVTVYDHGTIGGWSVQAAARTASTPDYFVAYPHQTINGHVGIPEENQPTLDLRNKWMYFEVYLKLNDLGDDNGALRITTDGFQQFNMTHFELRTLADEDLSYIQVVTNFEYANDAYDYAISRVYIDTGPDSQAMVFLGNSSTLANVTGKFILPPSSWNDSAISTTGAINIPAGYKYIYVVNSNGEINSIGLTYRIAGDINGDEKVDLADALLLQRTVLGIDNNTLTPQQRASGDMFPVGEGDGTLDASDLRLLQQKILNKQ